VSVRETQGAQPPPQEQNEAKTLQKLADEGRLLREPVFVEFLNVPGSRLQVDFYRLPPAAG
jgi:hypothetical protein